MVFLRETVEGPQIVVDGSLKFGNCLCGLVGSSDYRLPMYIFFVNFRETVK